MYPKYLADAAYKDTVERLQHGNSVDSNTMALSKNARDTSRAAVARNIGRAGTKKRRIYDLISKHNGLTDDEIEVLTGYTHQSASSSRNRLMNDGFVYATEERRRTRQGEKAIVWKAVDEDQAQQ
jgi:transcription initiation factor IIE alpha subunit